MLAVVRLKTIAACIARRLPAPPGINTPERDEVCTTPSFPYQSTWPLPAAQSRQQSMYLHETNMPSGKIQEYFTQCREYHQRRYGPLDPTRSRITEPEPRLEAGEWKRRYADSLAL